MKPAMIKREDGNDITDLLWNRQRKKYKDKGTKERTVFYVIVTINIIIKSDTNLVFNQVRATAHNCPKFHKWPKWAPSVNATIADHIQHSPVIGVYTKIKI